MHPELTMLTAYVDGALAPAENAALRAHLLTCAVCTARLDSIRADQQRITRALSAGPAPDVRAAVRARLPQSRVRKWVVPATGVAAGLIGVLLFAMLISSGQLGTAARAPARLLITDRAKGQIVEFDLATGTQLRSASVGPAPTAILYDAVRERLYVALQQSIVALDATTFAPLSHWDTPQPLNMNTNLALDARGGWLYVPQPGGVAVLALNEPALTLAHVYTLGATPSALALTPAGRTLYALAPTQARLWSIDIATSETRSQVLAQPDELRSGWLVLSPDSATIYVLLTRATNDNNPVLWHISRSENASTTLTLASQPPPYDLALLEHGSIAIPRGNAIAGGIELISTNPLSSTGQIDPDYDQHHVVAGPGNVLLGINFTHSTLTRYDSATRRIIWRMSGPAGWQPWDGVIVPK